MALSPPIKDRVESIAGWWQRFITVFPTKLRMFFERLEHYAAGITAIFTAFLAVSTTLLWLTTKQIGDDTQSSIDASKRSADAAVRLADATQRSINVSERLADAATEANRQSKEDSVRQQRPWVAVDAATSTTTRARATHRLQFSLQ